MLCLLKVRVFLFFEVVTFQYSIYILNDNIEKIISSFYLFILYIIFVLLFVIIVIKNLLLLLFFFRSSRIAHLIYCDFCPLVFHRDCLMPPLAQDPIGLWMCPNHPENFHVLILNFELYLSLCLFIHIVPSLFRF